MLLKSYEEAIPDLELAVKLSPDFENLMRLGWCYGLMGEKMKAGEIIEKMKNTEGSDIVGNVPIGSVYGAIGELDTFFQYYNKASEIQDFRLNWLKFYIRDTQMDKKDPRVLKLLEKIGQSYL